MKESEARRKAQATRSTSEPVEKRQGKKGKTEPRPVSIVSVRDEVARIEDNIRPKAKAKARARSSSDVEISTGTLNNNTDYDYWNAQSPNEIIAQFIQELIAMLIKNILKKVRIIQKMT